MVEQEIARCLGPMKDDESLNWRCDGAKCKVGGDWRSCKAQVEQRGYKLIFTQDAKIKARETGDNIVDSYGHVYGR